MISKYDKNKLTKTNIRDLVLCSDKNLCGTVKPHLSGQGLKFSSDNTRFRNKAGSDKRGLSLLNIV